MDREQIIDNLMATIDAAVDHIPKKWMNIRCMYIMAVQSVALPIYQAIPEIGMRIDVGPREKTEPLDGVVDQQTCVKGEVVEKTKKKRGLSKKRKMRIHDVDFTGTDIHDGSDVGDGDGEEEQANDELGLKKKVKKKDGQGKLRMCKKGKSAGNEEDECEEKVNDGEFIGLVTERKKTKRANKVTSTGVEDYAIKVVSSDDHGEYKKRKMMNGVKRSKCTDDDAKDEHIQLANERKKTKRANKVVNTASEVFAIKGFTDDHDDVKKLQLKKKEKKITMKGKDMKGKQNSFNSNNENHEHVVAYEEANLMNMDVNTAVDDDHDHDVHFRDDVSNMVRKSSRYKKPVKPKKIKLRL